MKIIVRAPNWLGDIIMSFPFLHALNEEFPNSDITVIIKQEYLALLYFLPFKVKAIPFSKEDHPGLVGIYKFAWNQPSLRHADLYFSLPPSFSSAFMGWCFSAKAKVGFRGEHRNIFLNYKSERPAHLHRSKEYLYLLSLFTGKDYSNYKKIISRDIDPFFKEWEKNRYLVINPNSEASSRRLPVNMWIELLNLFEKRRFVIIGTEKDQERIDEILAGVSKEKNLYINLAGKTNILELARVLAYAQGVITNDSGPAHLASYVGANVAVFFGAGDFLNTAPSYNIADAQIITRDESCSPCLKNICPLDTLACLKNLDIHGIAEDLHVFFKLN